MNKWNKLASKTQINKTVKNLTANGFNVIVVDNAKQAKAKVLGLIPKNSEVSHDNELRNSSFKWYHKSHQ